MNLAPSDDVDYTEAMGMPLTDTLARGLVTIGLCLLASAGTVAGESRTVEHQDMLKAIADSVKRTSDYTGLTELSSAVMAQMGAVPRHEFVPESEQARAYLNSPLPIGYDQTISQPLIVALMTELLEPGPEDTVLEVGTGSGYQAAVLSGLVKQVYSIEIVAPLAERATRTLQRLHYENVTVKTGDGYLGWPEHAPFDAIIVTAAPDKIPPPLLQQLKPGGRLVTPMGPDGGYQELVLITKSADGKTSTRSILPVRFVPLTGEH